MIRALATLLLVPVVAALPATAQMPACAGLPAQGEMNDCAQREYRRHDAAMNETYRKLLARLHEPRQRAQLEAAERAWVAYRDAFGAFQTSGTVGGSIHPMMAANCLDEKTNVHAAELARQLNCQEADPSCVH